MIQRSYSDTFYSHISANAKLNSNKDEYRSIVALNSDLPDASFFNKANLPIIAVDGAANYLNRIGISPNIIVGDLDSVDRKLFHNSKIVFRHNQNYCDFDKTLKYLEDIKMLPAIIAGATGGYIDHIMQNINIFLLSQNNVLYTPPIVCYAIKESKKFALRVNSKISIFGFPSATVSTEGLKWELNNAALTFPGYNSSFNRSISQEISIDIHSGLCLVMIYLSSIKDSGI